MDAAGIDKQRIAAHTGFPAPFGQSGFAFARGNAFEAQVKANGGAELLTLLREHLNLPIPEAHYDDLSDVGGNVNLDLRHAETRNKLRRVAADATGTGTMFDHPLLRLEVGGRHAYLEPDLIAFQLNGKFHVIEIKSFPVIDGHADGDKVAAAAIQSAVYVMALRQALADLDLKSDVIADETILVCPQDFSNRPVLARLDVRTQLTVLRRQLSRIARIDDLLDLLPPDLTFDLDPDERGRARRAPAELAAAIGQVDARYTPDCMNTCEMCFFCRNEARGCTEALGRDTREDLGSVERVTTVLRLARGAVAPEAYSEAAALLRTAARLRADVLGEAI